MADVKQSPLEAHYAELSDEEIFERIRDRRDRMGGRLVILGHHYQTDEVLQFAHYVGDSLKLSQQAAAQRQAEYVVFCGVHFMAESADIVTEPHVRVILPHLDAGCSMADMATLDQLERAWPFLTDAAGAKKVVPVTYVNSSAEIKAFCGRNDGVCCTSSNATTVIDWAFTQGDKVLFLPDQHLGRNTMYQMEYSLDAMLLYDPDEPNGGLRAEDVALARGILWKGFCSVHTVFTAERCREIRAEDPACRILVHPECPWEVFVEADHAGSTEHIIQTIDAAPDGSHWAIGTETHLVDRLARRHEGRLEIRNLATERSDCRTMGLIDPRHLLWVLDNLVEGNVVNRITVPDDVRNQARVSLDRMLDLKPNKPVKG